MNKSTPSKSVEAIDGFSTNRLPYNSFTHLYILLYTIGFYVLVIFSRPIGGYGVETDFYSAYVVQAQEFLEGIIAIDEFRGPFYQIVLALFSLITGGEFYVAGKILNVTCAGLSLLFVWKLIRNISDSGLAFIVMLFVSLNLNFARYAFTPGTDMLFFLLYIMSIFLLIKCYDEDSVPSLWFTAGLIVSLSYLTRYTGISLIVFAVILLVLSFTRHRTQSIDYKQLFRKLFFFALPIVILVGSWSIYCQTITGQLFFNKNFQNTALTVYKPDDISKDEWTLKHQNDFNSMLEVFSKDTPLFLKKILLVNPPTNVYKDLSRLFPRVVGLFVGIGLIFFIVTIRRRSRFQILYFASALLLFLQLLLIFYSERFSLPLVPFYIFVMVLFLRDEKLRKLNVGFGKIKLIGAILVSLCIFNAYSTFTILKAEINDVPLEILEVAQNSKRELGDTITGKTVMARKPHIAYYMNMGFATTPYITSIDELRTALSSTSSDYYFVNESESGNIENDELRKKLLDYDSPPEGFKVIAYSTNPVAIFYRVE